MTRIFNFYLQATGDSVMRRVLLFTMAVATVLAAATQASAAIITIDDGDTGYARTSGTWSNLGGVCAVAGDYDYTSTHVSTDAATYTPSQAAGFTPGEYYVYGSWAAATVHTTTARLTVNHQGGTQTIDVNQTQNASLGNSGSVPATGGTTSGYLYLGKYTLDNSSTVVMDRNNDAGFVNTYLTADALMLRSPEDGYLIDFQSDRVTADIAPSIYAGYGNTGTPWGALPYWMSDTTVTYDPVVEGPGLYDLSVSWCAVAPNASDAVPYLVDLNGNGIEDPEDTLITINQKMFNDQITLSPGNAWSGYYSLGQFNLTADSKVIQTRKGAALTIGPMVATALGGPTAAVPEPGTLVMLAAGMLGFFFFAWRRRRG